jgi:hypothetical protein
LHRWRILLPIHDRGDLDGLHDQVTWMTVNMSTWVCEFLYESCIDALWDVGSLGKFCKPKN